LQDSARPYSRRNSCSLVGRLWFVLMFLAAPVYSQNSDECLACHSDRALQTEKKGQTLSLFVDNASLQRSVHASLRCIDCHAGFSPADIPHAAKIRPVKCQTCHDGGTFEKSVHGRSLKAGAATCKDCHGKHQILSPSNPKSSANRGHISGTCGKCHTEEDKHYSQSAHGVALNQGVPGAPSCIDCHGEHNVELVASKESPIYKTHEARVCLGCHLDNSEVRKRMVPSAGFIAEYANSVHGVALASGNEKAATCSNCHGAHDMKKGTDSSSKVSKWNTAKTCGQCHAEIAKIFSESIHGKGLMAGKKDAPSCTDCHGEHQIYAPKDPRSRVSATNVSAQVCASCHSSLQLSRKYGLPSERFKTFEDSYHGLASHSGAVEVANCASCHGVHNIKPSSDPTSTINKANLSTTCGNCHPGANQNFAKGSIHIIMEPNGREAILYWIQTLYIGLIVVTIGGMVLHNLLDFIQRSRRRLALRQGRIQPHHYSAMPYERMTLNERIQHAALFTSFILLVITGFMLKFPDAWWVLPIRHLSEKFFQVRSLTHRIAGVVMVAASIYHIFYLACARKGRRLLLDLLPKLKDMRDASGLLKYNLGFSRSKPKFGRFGYIEKAEYWALVWGTGVMAGTGAIMWFDNYFIGLLTKLGWDIARTIHYYEAWLATLAIVVWHFYFVMLNPDIYPMNTAWFTGMISEEEMADEHPLELERVRSEQMADQDRQMEILGNPAQEPAKVSDRMPGK
jgi:cytochrome b subunit of formate dehydrogenase